MSSWGTNYGLVPDLQLQTTHQKKRRSMLLPQQHALINCHLAEQPRTAQIFLSSLGDSRLCYWRDGIEDEKMSLGRFAIGDSRVDFGFMAIQRPYCTVSRNRIQNSLPRWQCPDHLWRWHSVLQLDKPRNRPSDQLENARLFEYFEEVNKLSY
jgi:hypothetical protein